MARQGARAQLRTIDLADYLIGATAQEHRLELATLNVLHFPIFEDLRMAVTRSQSRSPAGMIDQVV